MTWFEIGLLLLGAMMGGFVNGLTGFGTALTAMPVWLQILPPPQAASLAAVASVAGQVQTLHLIRQAVQWSKVGPFVIAGLIGVPIGTWLLPMVEVGKFKLGLGLVLITYCGFNLVAARLFAEVRAPASRVADIAVGLIGGVLGGLASLSAPPLIVWTTFKPWSREEKRALFQVFNFTILGAAVVSSAVSGLLTGAFWLKVLIALPATYIGVKVGTSVYRRLDDRRFDRVVMIVLMAIGFSLVVSNA